MMVLTVMMFAAPEAALACHLGLGDRVWYDANRNGIQDSGGPGINGVRVTISPGYYSNFLDPNSFVTSMVTASAAGGDGYYLFNGIECDVTYTIAVDPTTIPDGLEPTLIGVGVDSSMDSDNPAGVQVTLPNIGSNYSNLTIDFGLVAPACTWRHRQPRVGRRKQQRHSGRRRRQLG